MTAREMAGDLLGMWLMVLSAGAEDAFSAWVGLGLAYALLFVAGRAS